MPAIAQAILSSYSFLLTLVPPAGLEPARPMKAADFESAVSTISPRGLVCIK